jgi:hypothetical protein
VGGCARGASLISFDVRTYGRVPRRVREDACIYGIPFSQLGERPGRERELGDQFKFD